MVGDVMRVLAGVVLTVALAVSPAAAASAPQQVPCSTSVTGTVSAVDLRNSTLTLKVNSSGTLTVWVQRASVLILRESAGAEQRVELGALRLGDRVSVAGVCLDNGRLLALRLMASREGAGAAGGADHRAAANGSATGSAASSAAPGPTATASTTAPSQTEPEAPSAMTASGSTTGTGSAAAASTTTTSPAQTAAGVSTNQIAAGTVEVVSGVVVGKTATSLEVRSSNGTDHTVLVNADTAVSGERKSLSAIARFDAVSMAAVKGKDGKLRAKRIQVILAAEKVIKGKVTAKGKGFIVINGNQVVQVNGDTQVMVNGELRSPKDLQVGAQVNATVDVQGTASGSTTSAPGSLAATSTKLVGTVIQVVGSVDP